MSEAEARRYSTQVHDVEKALETLSMLTDSLDTGADGDAIRLRSAVSLHRSFIALLRSDGDFITTSLLECVSSCQADVRSHLSEGDHAAAGRVTEPRQLSSADTRHHYETLFPLLIDDGSYWTRGAHVLNDRFLTCGVPVEDFVGARTLDMGCGLGRHTFGLHDLGSRETVGVDLSAANLDVAQTHASSRQRYKNSVVFVEADCSELPFTDCTFDIVHSNGVFHHMQDWRDGVSEMLRVLRPGGLGLVMHLNVRPAGMFEELFRILRKMCHGIPTNFAVDVLLKDGATGNYVVEFLDHVLSPFDHYIPIDEVYETLHGLGAVSVRRLKRGAAQDKVELVYNGMRDSTIRFGVGEGRFCFRKNRGSSTGSSRHG